MNDNYQPVKIQYEKGKVNYVGKSVLEEASSFRQSGQRQELYSVSIFSRTDGGTSTSKHQHLPDFPQSNFVPQRGQVSFSVRFSFINNPVLNSQNPFFRQGVD